jgi:hypothetical protein
MRCLMPDILIVRSNRENDTLCCSNMVLINAFKKMFIDSSVQYRCISTMCVNSYVRLIIQLAKKFISFFVLPHF